MRLCTIDLRRVNPGDVRKFAFWSTTLTESILDAYNEMCIPKLVVS